MSAYRTGLAAEALAGLWLRLKGYAVLDRRYRTPFGEIDLVCQKGDVLAFVEVKRRSGAARAVLALTPRQQARIARAAEAYLQYHPHHRNLDLRFDLVAIDGWRRIRHVRDVYRT